MTDEQIIRAAAEKVMGWKLVTGDSTPSEYEDADGILYLCWNPLRSIAGAFMLIDELVAQGWRFRISTIDKQEAVRLWGQGDVRVFDDNGDRCRAITLACLRAKGVEG